MSQPRECPYCGGPIPVDRSRSCGEIECRRAIRSGRTSRPRRLAPTLAETLPAPERRFLASLLLADFNLRTWE